MNDFKEWYDGAKKSNDDGFTAEDFYKAGQQSQEAKIDELEVRIANALKSLNLTYPENWAHCVDEAIEILKGE